MTRHPEHVAELIDVPDRPAVGVGHRYRMTTGCVVASRINGPTENEIKAMTKADAIQRINEIWSH